jgi:GT2 family glycosyltransferase
MTHDLLDISVVIVTWNGKEFIGRCLSSIRCALRSLRAEVFIVDNASTDGTPDLVEKEFPDFTLIRNTDNFGFARANNIAMNFARGKYVCLINSDVIATPDCLEQMVRFMDEHEDIGLLGPKMVMPDGTIGTACMRRPTLRVWLVEAFGLRSIFKNTTLHMSKLNHQAIQDVDVLNGWFWMARKSAVDCVGLLDEHFFMYGEDIEWCHRFWKQGWRVAYFPNAEATHHVGASASRAPVRFYIELQRANLQYWKIHHGKLSQSAFLLIIILHQMARILGFSVLTVLGRAKRWETFHKIKRSTACLAWVFGFSGIQQRLSKF